MRISDIIQLSKEYLLLGIIVVLFTTTIFLAGYFFVYKKLLKGTKTLSKKKLLLSAVFLCYLVVVLGATMMSRGSWYGGGTVTPLFSSYRDAWISFSAREWRNLILNILLFVPLGFLLPLIWERFCTFWKTYLAGFLLTLLIETMQLCLKRGIFELDDILNNTLGTMIGYGIIMVLGSCLKWWKQEEKKSVWKLAGFQIPLFVTILGFFVIFLTYKHQEYGNLSIAYRQKVDMSQAEVSLNTEISEEEHTADIYKLPVASREETLEFANEFLSHTGAQVDEKHNDFYDDTAVYRSTDGNYSLWVDYAGMSVDYTDFSKYTEDGPVQGKTGCSLEELLEALEKFGIVIPDAGQQGGETDTKEEGEAGSGTKWKSEFLEFTELENGQYEIAVDMYQEGDCLVNGTLTCEYTADEKLVSIRNHILTYEKTGSCTVISEQQAYEKIQEGKFYGIYLNDNETLESIEVEAVKPSYYLDSKGYYQPIYEFTVLINGEEGSILIPAMK